MSGKLHSHGQGNPSVIAAQCAAAIAQCCLRNGSSYCACRANMNFIKLRVQLNLRSLLKIGWNLDANIFTGVNQGGSVALVLPDAQKCT